MPLTTLDAERQRGLAPLAAVPARRSPLPLFRAGDDAAGAQPVCRRSRSVAAATGARRAAERGVRRARSSAVRARRCAARGAVRLAGRRRSSASRRRSSRRSPDRAASTARSPPPATGCWSTPAARPARSWCGSIAPASVRRPVTAAGTVRGLPALARRRSAGARGSRSADAPARHPRPRSEARLDAAHHLRCRDRCLADLVARRPAPRLPIESQRPPRPLSSAWPTAPGRARCCCAAATRSTRPTGVPTARTILFHTYTRDTGGDVWTMKADGIEAAAAAERAVRRDAGAAVARRHVARLHVVRERTRRGLRAQPRATRSGAGRCRPAAARDPRWRGDGRELFYISADVDS